MRFEKVFFITKLSIAEETTIGCSRKSLVSVAFPENVRIHPEFSLKKPSGLIFVEKCLDVMFLIG